MSVSLQEWDEDGEGGKLQDIEHPARHQQLERSMLAYLRVKDTKHLAQARNTILEALQVFLGDDYSAQQHQDVISIKNRSVLYSIQFTSASGSYKGL